MERAKPLKGEAIILFCKGAVLRSGLPSLRSNAGGNIPSVFDFLAVLETDKGKSIEWQEFFLCPANKSVSPIDSRTEQDPI
jgi:hypothetical protein